MGWNANEELTIDGATVPNTNILKLVKYILYAEDEHLKIPNGFNTFVEGLKTIGLESEWVRNESVKEELDNNENDWNTTDESDSGEESESVKSDGEGKGSDSDSSTNDDTRTNEEPAKIDWKNLSSESEIEDE